MPRSAKNVLFIMCDQLRADHLSCYGHPRLHTPHLDALARRGVLFEHAYVQSPVCGPSRMSYYTGRYMHAHGVSWNFVPLKVGEMTIGDHLRPLGVRSVLIGKTHMRGDASGISRLGIDPASPIGVRIAECGFDPFERDDGIHPYSGHDPDPNYNRYLREHGFDGDNPWEAWANTVVDEQGGQHSGWYLKYSHLPARVPAEHSETAYTTNRAMDFMRDAGDQPWLAHLSSIKPHWPYVVPAPYAGMYTPADALSVVSSEAERTDPHPVYGAMTRHRVSRTFAKPGIRDAVMVGYVGLVKQIDDELGRLFAFMEARGLMENTMIVFCADHGDFLGDHWLGDKELFHHMRHGIAAVDVQEGGCQIHCLYQRVAARAARGVRPRVGVVDDQWCTDHWLVDGRSLRPWLFGETPAQWRSIVVSECDYAFQDARIDLAGLRVRGLRHRCLRPVHRGLARQQLDAHRLRARRAGAGAVCAAQRA